MKPNRRRLLALITSAGTVSLAGCGGGDGDGGDDGDGGGDDGGENDGEDGGDGSGSDGSDGTDGTDGTSTDGGGDGSGTTATDDAGTSTPGATESEGDLQPSDVTGTVESSVPEVEVVGHEVTGVDPQVRVELELRNAGDESNIDLTHHNFDVGLFDAEGNDILFDQGSSGPEDFTGAGETGVVEFFLNPEQETRPARYEIAVNCDVPDSETSGFNYCEG